MAVFGFVKFWVCLKRVNISFEPEFGNPRFEAPNLQQSDFLKFSVDLLLSNVDFITWFCTNPSREALSYDLVIG